MPNVSIDATLALDIQAARAQQIRQEAQKKKAASRKPAEPSSVPDAIALYRADEVAAAWQAVEMVEQEAAEVIRLAKAAVTILRNRAIALGQEVTDQRMRLRWNSPAYDYDFARSVLGDAALPPKTQTPRLEGNRRDPLAALAEEEN